ncbi:matrixin family metalloprotease [Lentzea atacamensis]|nr:matrixin family metalloprotease [Lentzea atacamensis]
MLQHLATPDSPPSPDDLIEALRALLAGYLLTEDERQNLQQRLRAHPACSAACTARVPQRRKLLPAGHQRRPGRGVGRRERFRCLRTGEETTMRNRLAALVVVIGAVVPIGLGVGTAGAAPGESEQVTASVMSTQRNADGTVTQTTYTPAEGVRPADLARKLTANGVQGVALVNGAGDVSAQVAACSYGTARTWPTGTTCFSRWSYNGWARPQMYFRDRSNSLWPVGRAVTKWNETSGIDSHYRTFSAGCPSSTVHCVIVYNAAYGKTGEWDGVVGMTKRTLNAAQTYTTGAYIALNESYGGTEAQRWNTACHEIGHVLGLDHNTSTASCMYYARTSQRYPNANDFTLLETYY